MTENNNKTAFITGASRGIGAEAAVALAQRGYRVAITARTRREGERYDYAGQSASLPGSLERTAKAIASVGQQALCLQADILDQDSVAAAAAAALEEFGHIDLLFNNAVYQGPGNQSSVLEVEQQELASIYQGNVFTPLALVKAFLPGMVEQGAGTIINMVSYTAFNDPPMPAAEGGWGFAYPSSKAALARMAGALRSEHRQSGLRVFNLEPGTVITEMMKVAGIDKLIGEHFRTCSPAAIAAVVAWLARNDPDEDWYEQGVLRGPLMAKRLQLLDQPTLLQQESLHE